MGEIKFPDFEYEINGTKEPNRRMAGLGENQTKENS
jgi:hypothetical protein